MVNCTGCGGPILVGDRNVKGVGDQAWHEQCGTGCGAALARWDAGLHLNTVELAGLGPSHEQAIHIVAMELMRVLMDRDLAVTDEEKIELTKEIRVHLTKVQEELGLELTMKQERAAINFAFVTSQLGWEEAIAKAPGRRIVITKFFPTGGSR